MNVVVLTVVGLTIVLLLFAWMSMREGYANESFFAKKTPTTRKPLPPTTRKPLPPTTRKPLPPTTRKPLPPTPRKPTTPMPTQRVAGNQSKTSTTPRPRLVRIDGKVYPVCKDPSKAGAQDINKRRWGVENNTKCVVPRLPKTRTIMKLGNNGAVSCHAYCSGDWQGINRGLCRRAYDTGTKKDINCFAIRGKGAEVQCECDRKSKNRVFKDGNDGMMNCNTYCASSNGGGPKGKCVYALDIKNPNNRVKFDCGVVKGKGSVVGCVCESKPSSMASPVAPGGVIDGTTYKVCNNKAAASAPDNWGRRWGWENNAPCVVFVNNSST